MKKLSISIVIPTYKEARNVKHLVKSINCVMESVNYEYEIILVDDNSGDGIESLVSVLSEKFPIRIKIRRAERDLSASVEMTTETYIASSTLSNTKNTSCLSNSCPI